MVTIQKLLGITIWGMDFLNIKMNFILDRHILTGFKGIDSIFLHLIKTILFKYLNTLFS